MFALVEQHIFRKVDFVDTTDGHVRIRSPLTHELAENMPQWAKSLGPIAEHVAHVFGKAMDGTYSAAIPLTSRRHRDAQAVVRRARSRRLVVPLLAGASSAHPFSRSRLRCGPVLTAEELSLTLAMSAGDACIAADPAQAPEIRGRRGAAIAARKRALSEWDKANPDAVYDPELFRRDILPWLATVKLSEIVEAAGCSKASASDIRRGKWTPHVSTWEALAALVGVMQPARYAR